MKSYPFSILLLLFTSAASGYFNKAYEPATVRLYETGIEKKLITTFNSAERSNVFLEKAALIASGAVTYPELKTHGLKLKRIISLCIKKISSIRNSYRKCRKLLSIMHKTIFKKYRSTRTTVLNVLKNGEYNCVSSAFLYNIILDKTGMKTRAVIIPGHVYSQVFVNRRWIDVETTMHKGFDPIRRDGLPTTPDDRQFIPEKGDRTKRKFISNSKFVALFYYNRATLQFHNRDGRVPFRLFFKALKLFPKHLASEKNLTAVIVNWGASLIRKGRTNRATEIGVEGIRILGGKTVFYSMIREAHKEGARLAAEQKDFKKAIRILFKLNRMLPLYHMVTIREIQGYYARWAQHLLRTGKLKDMLYVINSASRKWPSPFLKGFKIHLVSRAALHFFMKGNNAGGIDFFNKNIPKYGESKTAEINRQYLYNRWGNITLSSGQYRNAYTIFKTALSLYPGNRAFINSLNRVADIWSEYTLKTSSVEQWIHTSQRLYLQFRNRRFLSGISGVWKKRLQDLNKRNDFRKAFLFLDKLRYHQQKNSRSPLLRQGDDQPDLPLEFLLPEKKQFPESDKNIQTGADPLSPTTADSAKDLPQHTTDM